MGICQLNENINPNRMDLKNDGRKNGNKKE
jgi:hypothetical protein